MIVLVLFAFLAGLVTIFSPCILPILPVILTSSIGGVEIGKSRAYGVVTGFILSFTFFTLFLSTIVRLSGIPADSLRIISVVVVGLFGISMLTPQLQIFLEKLFSKLSVLTPKTNKANGFWGGIFIGLSIGLLWTPCVGPILASVISLAITGSVDGQAVIITLAYALGTAIPMWLIIIGGQSVLRRVPWLLTNLGTIQKVFGIIMILTAIGLFFNVDRQFQTWILQAFPAYGSGLTKLEDNQLVQKQLNQETRLSNLTDVKNENPSSLLSPKGVVAPEIIPGGEWFNLADGQTKLTLADLKGKVVIVDFWTYSCINCQRTLPYLKAWHQKYADQGLVILGVHAPEFEFEKSAKNVSQAIKDFDIKYPVVQDNLFDTWRAYKNRYWPAKYFIDKDGFVRYEHFGEGAYEESEKVIQELLQEAGVRSDGKMISPVEVPNYAQTHESYLGYGRIKNQVATPAVVPDELTTYQSPKSLKPDELSFQGEWLVKEEYAQPKKGSSLWLNFTAKEVYLVMRNTGQPAKVKVTIDGQTTGFGEDNNQGIVTVTNDDLYKLIKLDNPGQHLLKLEFEDDNAQVFAFTFG